MGNIFNKRIGSINYIIQFMFHRDVAKTHPGYRDSTDCYIIVESNSGTVAFQSKSECSFKDKWDDHKGRLESFKKTVTLIKEPDTRKTLWDIFWEDSNRLVELAEQVKKDIAAMQKTRHNEDVHGRDMGRSNMSFDPEVVKLKQKSLAEAYSGNDFKEPYVQGKSSKKEQFSKRYEYLANLKDEVQVNWMYSHDDKPYRVVQLSKIKLYNDTRFRDRKGNRFPEYSWVPVVIYECLYPNADGQIWVRFKEDFINSFKRIR